MHDNKGQENKRVEITQTSRMLQTYDVNLS